MGSKHTVLDPQILSFSYDIQPCLERSGQSTRDQTKLIIVFISFYNNIK
jgi:hypothetical protein